MKLVMEMKLKMTARIPTLKKKDMIAEVQKIIRTYRMKMTLRQIYYRLVAKNLIENTISQYKRLSTVLVYAREQGMIDPYAMEDRHRQNARVPDDTYKDPDKHFKRYLGALLVNHLLYKLPKWMNQPVKVIVSLEKDALSGIFGNTCSSLGCGFVVGKGYNSYTQIYDLARRLERFDEKTTKIIMLYFGDFDSSGKDIIRSLQERLEKECDSIDFEHDLIALTKDQIDHWNLPHAPAKKTDSRTASFVAEHGDMAVELDAIEPTELQKLIKDSVNPFFDEDIYAETNKTMQENRDYIEEFVDMVEEVIREHKPELLEEDDDEEDGLSLFD